MLLMLEVDKDLECPRAGPPALPPVEARARCPACRTRSVRICRWKRDPVAASESMGISSFTCTVWACCRKLSSRENLLEQWHWKGRSPVCFLPHVSSGQVGDASTKESYIPDMSSQVLASGKTEAAWRELRTIEPL